MPPDPPAAHKDGGEAGAVPGGAVQLPATLADVRRTLAGLTDRWRAYGIPPDLADHAELVLAEVLNNVVEHAVRGHQNARITVEWDQRPGGLDLRVTDTGKPMPGGDAPAGDLPERPDPATAPSEGGYGWFLIRSLAKDLSYRRVDGVNELRISLGANP